MNGDAAKSRGTGEATTMRFPQISGAAMIVLFLALVGGVGAGVFGGSEEFTISAADLDQDIKMQVSVHSSGAFDVGDAAFNDMTGRVTNWGHEPLPGSTTSGTLSVTKEATITWTPAGSPEYVSLVANWQFLKEAGGQSDVRNAEFFGGYEVELTGGSYTIDGQGTSLDGQLANASPSPDIKDHLDDIDMMPHVSLAPAEEGSSWDFADYVYQGVVYALNMRVWGGWNGANQDGLNPPLPPTEPIYHKVWGPYQGGKAYAVGLAYFELLSVSE